MGPMRQANGQQPADGLQRFFVDTAMQADVDSVSAPSTATSWRICGACCHAGDEQLLRPVVCSHRWAAAVRSAPAVCHAVWSCSWPSAEQRTSQLIQLAVYAVHEQGFAILIPGKSQAARSIVVQPRAVDCHGAGLQVVRETLNRPSWDPMLLFPYGTDGFHLDIPKDGKAKAIEHYCWRLMQRNGRAWGDRLFQQYVVDACAKMEQQRLNYLRFNQNSLRSWRCSGEWRRWRRSSSAQFYVYSL